MTEIQQRQETSSLARLRGLLGDVSTEPVQLVEELSRTRQEVLGEDGALLLEQQELAFLERQARHAHHAGEDLVAAVETARRTALRQQQRHLAQLGAADVAALFDAAELRAALLTEGMAEQAQALGAALQARIAAVVVDDALVEEARERFAALSTEEEELSLRHKVHLLQETAAVLDALAERSGDARLRRMARRLGRAAADRVLAQRLERLLTRRGAVVLETTSLVGLLVVLVLLGIEAGFALSPGALRAIALVDASICVLFVLEFLFKLALAPGRLSWFLRNVVTDLLPALPAALLLFVEPATAAEAAVPLRALRLLRVTWFARYIAALRPGLGVVRLILFLARGLDALTRRFSALLNRDFVFFEERPEIAATRLASERQSLAWRALRREHVLLQELPAALRTPLLVARAERLSERLGAVAPHAPSGAAELPQGRAIPVEQAIDQLQALRPEDLAMVLPRREVLALDRVCRVINAPFVRALPFVRRLSFREQFATPDERVVRLAHRIADWIEAWRNRALTFADLHGVVTGPQILDRIATAMVTASQRPAVRLLFFGAMFFIVRALVGEDSVLGGFLKRFVATPLVVLGGVCLVFLWLGRWLKGLAGEAAEAFKLTSEAHFISLVELLKQRSEEADLAFLSRRVFRFEMEPMQAAWALTCLLQQIRTGRSTPGHAPISAALETGDVDADLMRVALLYLHFLDGAVLHATDIKTTEQLLANPSLENVRLGHLHCTRQDRKRLRRLSLTEGSLFRGPYMWFLFITESVAVETAKRITDYNRNCMTLAQRRVAEPARLRALHEWLERKRAEMSGRTVQRPPPPDEGPPYSSTDFNALDFLTIDPERERALCAMFGAEVVDLLRADRRRMIREIFGTKPLHRLPRSRRTLNGYAFYWARLSRGRIFLLPLHGARLFLRSAAMVIGKVVAIVREILAPQRAQQRRESGAAPFAAALRKIHRMKAPGCLEAMDLRARFDPAYAGAPCTWSEREGLQAHPEVERDMDFLRMKERDRQRLRELASHSRARVQEWIHLLRHLPPFPDLAAAERRHAECAVIVTWVTGSCRLRTLLRAESWLERELPRLQSKATHIPAAWPRRALALLLRGLRRHPVDRWLSTHLAQRGIGVRVRRNLKRSWHRDPELRETVRAWLALPAGVTPTARGIEIAQRVYRDHSAIQRELTAVRAVQSLSILDVRNYRELVFRLGDYAAEGEDPCLAEALP